jgi:two-component system response regulator MprA
LCYADVELNIESRLALRGNRKLELTPREFDLLVCFLQHPDRVLSRDKLIELAWGHYFEGDTRSVNVYVGYLRRKLEIEGQSRLIQTVRGVGYILRETRNKSGIQDGTF